MKSRLVPELNEMVLVKNSRLSVQPVTEDEWNRDLQTGRRETAAKVQFVTDESAPLHPRQHHVHARATGARNTAAPCP